MKLKDMTIKEYINEIDSSSPAPGGGSASALMGLQGVALISMVAKLTLRKEKYIEHEESCKEIILKCEKLREKLIEQIDLDTEAYNKLAQAFKMPKETDEEKDARKKAIIETTQIATNVPFKTMELCLEGLNQVQKLLNGFNTNCSSDVGVAVLNLNGGLKGAYMNVQINLIGAHENSEEWKLLNNARMMSENSEKIAKSVISTINNYL